MTHRLPSFLPDGKRLLYFSGTGLRSEGNGIHVLDLASKESTLLLNINSGARYVPPGWIVFFRQRTLMAQRFDPQTLTLEAEAVPIAENVRYSPNRWFGTFAMSETGRLIYQTGSNVQAGRLTWFDLDGKQLATIGGDVEAFGVRIAPDGRRAAVVQAGPEGMSEIWMYDLARGLGSRFTFAQDSAAIFPVFSPDSRQVAFGGGEGKILVVPVERTEPPRAIIDTKDVVRMPTSWSPDGRVIVYREQSAQSGWNVRQIDARGGEPKPLLAGPSNEDRGQVSPDGRWLAYLESELGERDALYIVPFADPAGRKYQVTPGGASALFAWMPDGRRILYQADDRQLQIVDVTPEGQGLVIGAPRTVFGDRPAPLQWSLHPDGRRLLTILRREEEPDVPLVLVTDWAAGLAPRN